MVQENDQCFVIAEAGVNHNGSIDLAKELVECAAQAGADAVKFQTFTADAIVTDRAAKVKYQEVHGGDPESQKEMIRGLELSREAHFEIFSYSEQLGIEFFSTPFDLDSLAFLADLGVKRFKIPSGEITNFLLLRETARCGKPMIMSTGMASMEEIEAGLEVLLKYGLEYSDITILHCTTAYPAPVDSVNLRAMDLIREKFPLVSVGFSDHTEGTTVSIAAAARGARVIEKHFTLDRSLPGPDHKASLEPVELKEMVAGIRTATASLGKARKFVTDAEKENIVAVRKSIVAARSIKTGEVFTEENLTAKRPGDGRSPMEWCEVIGKTADKDYAKDELI